MSMTPQVFTCLRGRLIYWHRETFAALLPTRGSCQERGKPCLSPVVTPTFSWQRGAAVKLPPCSGAFRHCHDHRSAAAAAAAVTCAAVGRTGGCVSGDPLARLQVGSLSQHLLQVRLLGHTCAVGSGWGLWCAFQKLWLEIADVINYCDSNVWWRKWIKGSSAQSLFIYLHNRLIFHSGLPSSCNNLPRVVFYWGRGMCVKFSASSQHISIIYPYFFPFREL